VTAPLATAVWAALVCGALGGVVGLVLGLVAYPPTAWFAVLEIGLPATCVGGVVGLAVGAVRAARS
jgi:hypothetical protein